MVVIFDRQLTSFPFVQYDALVGCENHLGFFSL
jgi:hypothetical protein